jgi:hypothetical protein
MVDRDAERPHDDIDPDAPASADEVAASKRLRDALEGGATADASPEVELALALRAAWDPGALSADESRAMLDATPSAEEQDLAVRLREALASKLEPTATAHATVQLAHALRAAFAPAALDEREHRVILDAALAKMPAAEGAGKKPARAEEQASNVIAMKRRATVVRVAFGFVAGGLALAASVVLVVTSAPGSGSEAPLAKARTTQPLFSEPFKAGETSARIDRIASARAGDFRDNRFTKWGVR